MGNHKMKNRFGGRNELLNKIRNWVNHYRSRTFGVRRGKGRVGQEHYLEGAICDGLLGLHKGSCDKTQ